MNRTGTHRAAMVILAILMLAGCKKGVRGQPDPVSESPGAESGLTLKVEGSAPMSELTAQGCIANVTLVYQVSGPPNLVSAAEGQDLEIKITATPSGAPLDGTTHKATVQGGVARFEIKAGPIKRGTQVTWRAHVQRLGDLPPPKGFGGQTGFGCT